MPSAKAVAGVNVQFPEASAVAVPREVAPCKMLTVLLASAVPVIVGVESLVVPAAVVIVGAVGTTASTNTPVALPLVKVRIALALLAF